ncbi:MAG: hypothetical protein R6V73_01305 [Anaerolineales bacterium]
MQSIEVYLEIGKKRTFAGALSWPGWCRSGKDEAAALQALCDYGKRYAMVIQTMSVLSTDTVLHTDVSPPTDPSVFGVVERLVGDATTDFGGPGQIPAWDQDAMHEAELLRSQDLLRACWQVCDTAAAAALGKQLRLGPRGGGRDLDRLIRHVEESEAAYLGRLGGRLKPGGDRTLNRQTILDTLAASAHGEIPALGPRGGLRWSARTFVRRAAWHLLDHAWELEDRII